MRNQNNNQKIVLCPFYRSDDRQRRKVTCEGIFDSSRISQEFDTRKDYEEQVKTICGAEFECCEIYRMLLDSKYGK